MKALVVFGSESDNKVFEPFVENLKANGVETDFQVISAHRNLEKLQETILEDKWDFIVAGAGLAAALPGVVAAMTDRPVFGIPVKAHFGGIDALASIAQMPYGVPVLTCGAGREDEIIRFIKDFKKSEGVNIVINPVIIDTDYAQKELNRLQELAAEKDIKITINADDDNSMDIVLVNSPNELCLKSNCINVPLIDPKKLAEPEHYLDIYYLMDKGGLWVCANNSRNALLSVLKLFNI